MYETTSPFAEQLDQSEYLSVLGYASAEDVKAFAAAILDEVGPIEVLGRRSELVSLPYVQPEGFNLGEVLVTEVQLQTADGTVGFGAAIGADDEHAMAIAILDAAMTAGRAIPRIMDFVDYQARQLAEGEAA